MIQSASDVNVYAIDNGLDGDKNSQQSQLYTQFLKDLFSREDCVNSISQAILETLENTLSDGVGLSEQENLFIDDLKCFGTDAVKSGMITIYNHILLSFDTMIDPLDNLTHLMNPISDRKNLLHSLRSLHDL